MILSLLGQVRERMLTPEKLREWDAHEIFPEQEIRQLLAPDIGLQLLFIPEAYGGMGGGARDMAAFSEEMAKICLGVATAFLAIHLGADPILVGATEEQKQKWLTRLAEGDAIVAYAVTESDAGSNLSSLGTSATPVLDGGGALTGYCLRGTKQFISNGGVADFMTVLAQAPEGPSFFIVENTMEGFLPGRPEQKHGIRSSNTSALTFDDVFVPVENLVGGVPGQGLAQANEVFGYTRLMVACFGLGAGVAALDKVIAYAKERVQFGSPLIEKQGYTHKLVLPFVAKLETARAYIEEVAVRLDSGETDLQPEGAIAKLYASEVGNACADAAIQALGGYGYTSRIRRGEDQARCEDHHHLRRHKRDHATDHQHLPLAGDRQVERGFLRIAGRADGRSACLPSPAQGRHHRVTRPPAEPPLRGGPQHQTHPPATPDVPVGLPRHTRGDRRGSAQEGRRSRSAGCHQGRLPHSVRPHKRGSVHT